MTVVLLLVGGFSAILLRLLFLHVFEGPALAHRAERQHQRMVTLEGERGKIYDRRGRELAINVDVYSLYGDPSRVDNPRGAARSLASLLAMETGKLERRLAGPGNFVWIERRLPPDLVRKVETLIIPGIGWIPESKRFYPKRELLAPVLGFSGIDNRGLEGVERGYDSVLKGKTVELVLERDARGRAVFGKTGEEGYRGNDLILTIDEVVQYLTEQELDRAVQEHQAVRGMAVVMNPWTGEILAMSVRPGFNPNFASGYRPEQWRNRIITDVYEPGSTFKIVTAAGVLEEKLLKPGDVVDDGSGTLVVSGAVIHDSHPAGRPLTLEEVIQHSSNVGAAKMGMMLGGERLDHYIRAFGFGRKTGVDLPGEVRGLVSDRSRWSGRSLATISIGQEVAVTPIQLVRAMAAIANGGWLIQPRVVHGVRTPEGEDRLHQPELARRVISPETARQLGAILKRVTEKEGTAYLANVPGYEVAGKMGTAQKVDPATGRYSSDQFVSSFVGYLPADRPEIAVLVVVDSPKGLGWGGSVAAPVFSRIAAQTLRYLHAPGQEEKIPLVVAKNP